MNYEATKKQLALYRKLTGEWLPRGCGKAKASKLIAEALAGNGPKPMIKVGRYRVTTTMDSCRKDAATYVPPIRWEVSRNYLPVYGLPLEATKEEAIAFAQAKFPGVEIIVSDGIREVFVD